MSSSERQSHGSNTRWWGEHLFRYESILNEIEPGDIILDLACGTGYGSYALAKNSDAMIYGGDISEEAIALCNKSWTADNLKFQIIDGTQIPFDNGIFSRVVSFETVEHTRQYEKIIEEFVRVLKRGGFLYLSTPNKMVTNPDGRIRNKYHTQEFTSVELMAILQSHFSSVTMLGQKYIRYKKNTSLRFSIASMIEKVLYIRGVRKIPMTLQNRIIRYLIGKPFYPQTSDFALTSEQMEIEKCPVLFAICVK